MAEISLLGLGAMGSALARGLLAGGHRLTVWNRTAEKADAVVAHGAARASSVAAALEASPLVLICVADYAVAHALLAAPDAIDKLAGKTLVQLSTGTPREARESAAWAKRQGADYLDGAIMCFPVEISRPDARILIAGTQHIFERCRPCLACLAGDLRHVGDNIAAAAALDFAILSQYLGRVVGVMHGLLLCEAEQVGSDVFAALWPEGDDTRVLAEIVGSGNLTDRGASIAVWSHAWERIRIQAREAGINAEVPEFVAGLFSRAIAAGYGGEDVASLIKLLRASR